MRRIPLRGQVVAAGEEIELPEEVNHYIRNVLRLAPGAVLELFDGAGRRFAATLTGIDPATVSVSEELPDDVESPCRITLYQALAKGDHFELVVEKATELGVAVIVPLETARTVVKVKADKREAKQERWQRIADGAARQSGRSIVPMVEAPATLADALRHPAHATEILLHPHVDGFALADAVSPATPDVGIWVGPEGGFSPDEVDALLRRARPVSLGPRILRTETAGIVATALVQYLSGGLG